jgi:hypothetical protein
MVTRKTLDFLMASAQGEDISGFLKPVEEGEPSQDDSEGNSSEEE